MRRNTVLGVCLILILGILSGCQNASGNEGETETARLPNLIFTLEGVAEETYENPTWLVNTAQISEPSESVDVHLFVDGSRSMRGYLAYSGSTYDRMVTALPSVCINAFESYDFYAYKVFDDVYEMKDTDHEFNLIGENYVDYVYEKDFYGTEMAVRSGEVRAADKTRCDYAEIISAIEAINPSITSGKGANDELYIIISDFIPQSRDDIDFYRFNTKLYSEIISEDLCCGIAGFESEFYGSVECLDIYEKPTSFEYNGYMPFYMMVIGETQNVTRFMSSLKERIDHFELLGDEYGIFITDGQCPKNTGAGDVMTVLWDETLVEGMVAEQLSEAMVSYTLLNDMACSNEDDHTSTKLFNLFPAENYDIATDTITGEIRFTLPYVLSPASSIDIADADWRVETGVDMVTGEQAVVAERICSIEESCEGAVAFPDDMSLEAFDYIYDLDTPNPKQGQSILQMRIETWEARTEEYKAQLTARSVNMDEWFIELGAGYVEGGEVVIPIAISAEKMVMDMPYWVTVEFTASPKITTQTLDAWISEWNMDYSEFTAWSENPQIIDVGKTPGLTRAFKALQGDRIYDDGLFKRQVTLVFAKSEVLADEEILEWAQQKQAEQTKASESTSEKDKESGGLFNIFKKGDKE